MEIKAGEGKTIDIKIIFTVILTLIASIVPEIIMKEWTGAIPRWLPYGKLGILLAAGGLCVGVKKLTPLLRYTGVLCAISTVQILMSRIGVTVWWQSRFHATSFIGNFGGTILLKLFGALILIGFLLILFKSPREVYLCKGDLSVKAEEIKWLGIDKERISWGKLSWVSAILISFGTILLTLFTVSGITSPNHIEKLLGYLPIIALLALVNSFCEGIMFRNAIIGPLTRVLPKDQVIMVAAAIFGIAHYYGAPSGLVGVVMSGALGWYMCRSVYETKGFLAAWIIHFMQDVVIFSTIIMMSNLY